MRDPQLTILTPDAALARHAARRLTSLLARKEITAHVQEVTCYLELARQGVQGQTPLISVDERLFRCRSLDDALLEKFADWLAADLLADGLRGHDAVPPDDTIPDATPPDDTTPDDTTPDDTTPDDTTPD
jgi:hypothetical protein